MERQAEGAVEPTRERLTKLRAAVPVPVDEDHDLP